MTKAELIDKVYSAMGCAVTKREVEDIIGLTFIHIRNSIEQEHRFSMPKFGTFTKRYKKARRGVNPRTGRDIRIPATHTVGFKPSPNLKKAVNE